MEPLPGIQLVEWTPLIRWKPLWVIPSYLQRNAESVETLHGGAEMPKIKSSRQAKRFQDENT